MSLFQIRMAGTFFSSLLPSSPLRFLYILVNTRKYFQSSVIISLSLSLSPRESFFSVQEICLQREIYYGEGAIFWNLADIFGFDFRKRGRDESSEREQRHVHVSLVALAVAGWRRLRRDYVLFHPRRGRRSRREQRNCIVVVATLSPQRCHRLQRLRMRPCEVYTARSHGRDHSPRSR